MKEENKSTQWTEVKYTEYLESERHMYAWCLIRYGGMSHVDAEAEALVRYPYEPADAEYRGSIFHDEAWHWAMLHLHGEGYWLSYPELESQSVEYKEESQRCDKGK